MNEKEYREILARRRYSNAEDLVRDWADRFERRQCMCCGADSGSEPLLPPGWTYLTFGSKSNSEGALAAFICNGCAEKMGLPEARNYGATVN